MHDIDRTTREYGHETGFEAEQFEFGGQGEFAGEGEFGGQHEFGHEFAGEGEFAGESSQGFMSEEQEMALAHELLSVNNEQELEQFLGNVFRRVASTVGKVIKSPIGQALGGVLKGVAKKALPLAGGALGGFFGGPLGAKIGSGLASAAGGALGLEAEMSGEEREMTGARQFVRLATDAAAKAAQATGGNPRAIAQSAAVAAARRFAPGLLNRNVCTQQGGQQGMGMQAMGTQGSGMQGSGMQGGGRGAGGRMGRWARQGNKIVLYGA